MHEHGAARGSEEHVRPMYVRKILTKRYEYTPGCPGCREKQSNIPQAPHSQQCRQIIMKAMENDDEGKRDLERDAQRIKEKTRQKEDDRVVRIEEDQEMEEAKDENMEVKEEEIESAPEEEEEMTWREYVSSQGVDFGEIQVTGPDLVEIYSPESVSRVAEKKGLTAGYSMDIKTGWDFRRKSHRKAAWEYIKENKPSVVIGSPECKMFSTLQNFHTWNKEKQTEMEEAREHLAFVCKIYTLQAQEGRCFVHEHPAGATSWQTEEVQKVQSLPYVKTITMDQCMYGQYGWKEGKWRRIKKPTKWMTNCMNTKSIERRCDNLHEHVEAFGRIAKGAAIYSKQICTALADMILE